MAPAADWRVRRAARARVAGGGDGGSRVGGFLGRLVSNGFQPRWAVAVRRKRQEPTPPPHITTARRAAALMAVRHTGRSGAANLAATLTPGTGVAVSFGTGSKNACMAYNPPNTTPPMIPATTRNRKRLGIWRSCSLPGMFQSKVTPLWSSVTSPVLPRRCCGAASASSRCRRRCWRRSIPPSAAKRNSTRGSGKT